MTGAGSSLLLAHRSGKDLTPGQAIKAKCADCMGNYADGRQSCVMPGCPLYPYMPYNADRRKRSSHKADGTEPGDNCQDDRCTQSGEICGQSDGAVQ